MEITNTCGLCREQILNDKFERLDFDKIRSLKTLINLEKPVNEQAIICSKCDNVCQESYNFKNACLRNDDNLKTFNRPNDESKLILEDVIVKTIKSEVKCEEERVCRFCLNYFEANSLVQINAEEDVTLKNMLGRCLPEIDMSIVQNPFICYICRELLEKLFNFISQCEDTEVLRNLDMKTELFVNEETSTVSIENYDDNIDNCFMKKEEIFEHIENPEIQIKSEDCDVDEDTECKVCPYKAVSKMCLHTHQQKSRKFSKPSKWYQCTECLFQSKFQSSLIRHKKNHKVRSGDCGEEEQKLETYKCNKCSFSANIKRHIARHKRKDHTNQTQVKYSCDLCPHQTNEKSSLKLHYRVHQDLAFKCHKCHFVTKWERSLISHYKRLHEGISNLPKYKCDKCPYETIWTWELNRHRKIHRDSSEVKMYKCADCSHKTKRKSCLQKHEIIEEKVAKPNDETKKRKFVCDVCSYKADKSYSLKRHYLTHKEPSEVNMFKCDYCPFATKWKTNLTLHGIRHKNLSQLPNFKCNDCSYETHQKSNLVRHTLVHKHPSEVTMFKCEVCPYETKHRQAISAHEKKHKAEIYMCEECNYKTKFKSSFRGHARHHRVEATGESESKRS